VIPVLLGPTASAKTSIGIELARLLNAEVISVDSRKVYRGLSIGTAVPEGTWDGGVYMSEGIVHHYIGVFAPDEPTTAGRFAQDAEALILDIQTRGKTALLVGGTGFYFKALQQGLPALPPSDLSLRRRLMERAAGEGIAALHQELGLVDAAAAAAISAQDTHKVVRALEVYTLTGRPFSDWKNAPRRASQHQFKVMGLLFPKEDLFQRIEQRSQRMVEMGMIQEAQSILDQGYLPTCPALMSFGYREAVQVLGGLLPFDDFLPLLIKNTKAYAKRQLTWFRTQVQPHWFDCDSSSNKLDIALKMKDFLHNHE
jgi:tRNA dimethylallyltransferase